MGFYSIRLFARAKYAAPMSTTNKCTEIISKYHQVARHSPPGDRIGIIELVRAHAQKSHAQPSRCRRKNRLTVLRVLFGPRTTRPHLMPFAKVYPTMRWPELWPKSIVRPPVFMDTNGPRAR